MKRKSIGLSALILAISISIFSGLLEQDVRAEERSFTAGGDTEIGGDLEAKKPSYLCIQNSSKNNYGIIWTLSNKKGTKVIAKGQIDIGKREKIYLKKGKYALRIVEGAKQFEGSDVIKVDIDHEDAPPFCGCF